MKCWVLLTVEEGSGIVLSGGVGFVFACSPNNPAENLALSYLTANGKYDPENNSSNDFVFMSSRLLSVECQNISTAIPDCSSFTISITFLLEFLLLGLKYKFLPSQDFS